MAARGGLSGGLACLTIYVVQRSSRRTYRPQVHTGVAGLEEGAGGMSG